MITVNATVKFTYRNKGTFFGVHVSSTPLDLSYSEIVIGTGNVSLLLKMCLVSDNCFVSLIAETHTHLSFHRNLLFAFMCQCCVWCSNRSRSNGLDCVRSLSDSQSEFLVIIIWICDCR